MLAVYQIELCGLWLCVSGKSIITFCETCDFLSEFYCMYKIVHDIWIWGSWIKEEILPWSRTQWAQMIAKVPNQILQGWMILVPLLFKPIIICMHIKGAEENWIEKERATCIQPCNIWLCYFLRSTGAEKWFATKEGPRQPFFRAL